MNKVFFCFSSVLQNEQSGSTEKKMGVFSKGQVQIDATVNKTAFATGNRIPFNYRLCFISQKIFWGFWFRGLRYQPTVDL